MMQKRQQSETGFHTRVNLQIHVPHSMWMVITHENEKEK
jgi:hypothetical protein